LIRKVLGCSSVVLPVVGIYTQGFVMFSEVQRAENGFVVKSAYLQRLHVKVIIVLVIVDKLSVDLSLTVRKRAEVAILAQLNIVGIVSAELDLILVGAVELLCVSTSTSTREWAFWHSSPCGHFFPSSMKRQRVSE